MVPKKSDAASQFRREHLPHPAGFATPTQITMTWQLQVLILALIGSPGIVSRAADEIDYARIKGDAL